MVTFLLLLNERLTVWDYSAVTLSCKKHPQQEQNVNNPSSNFFVNGNSICCSQRASHEKHEKTTERDGCRRERKSVHTGDALNGSVKSTGDELNKTLKLVLCHFHCAIQPLCIISQWVWEYYRPALHLAHCRACYLRSSIFMTLSL